VFFRCLCRQSQDCRDSAAPHFRGGAASVQGWNAVAQNGGGRTQRECGGAQDQTRQTGNSAPETLHLQGKQTQLRLGQFLL